MNQQGGITIGAVAVVKGTAPDHDLLKHLLAERIRVIPRCTQVLGSDSEWIDHPEFDLDHHVQRVALPWPGDESELFRAVTNAVESPLDPARPLWECWVIERLAEHRWAIVMKVHHRLTADLSPAYLLTRLCDDDEAFVNRVAVQQRPPSRTDTPSWTDTLRQAPVNAARAAARMISPGVPPITMRRYRTVQVPRASVETVARKFGVPANDVALAAITEGFRTVLLGRGEQPTAESLRTWGPLQPYLPLEYDDPVRQLRAVHRRVNGGDRSASGGFSIYSPFAMCAKAFQAMTRPAARVVTLATDHPGPRHRLWLTGQPVDSLLPIPPTAPELSTGVAVLSYGDELVFGLTSDYRAAPELEQLAAGIESGMARLTALSQDSVLLFDGRRKRPARTVPAAVARRRPASPPVRVRH